MIIYSDTVEEFIKEVQLTQIADKISDNFLEYFHHKPSKSEYNSWNNSLSHIRDVIEIAQLRDNYISVEYEIPYNQKRIDCLLFGKSVDDIQKVVLIELKQWEKAEPTEDEGNFVETYTGGGNRIVPHPSAQVEGYHNYLENFVSEFDEQPTMKLYSCAFCHNYHKEEDKGLYDPKFNELIDEFPLYSKEDKKLLANQLIQLLSKGEGTQVFNRFMQSRIRPSQKLLENVSNIIQNKEVFSLLDEQIAAKNMILSKIKQYKGKSVIIIHGGPGTGKSVIALNVLAEVARTNKTVFWGCKSKPFSDGIKGLVGKKAAMLFSSLYRFVPSKVSENEADLLLIDEAHRIEKKSNNQYTPSAHRTDMPQVEQLIRCAKTSVFFIDDKQNVRGSEVGSTSLIKEHAEKYNARIQEITLLTQFRCMGSNDYLLWLDSVLGYSDEKRILKKHNAFDFRIFDTPQEIYDLLAEKEKTNPNANRIVAGFCWPWSKKLDDNGELVKDVVVGDFAMPWETPDEVKPPKGYVNWAKWAIKPEGFKQVGCIYTAQGFEFDYIGVIIGDDLDYNPVSDSLKGNKTSNKDPMLNTSQDFDRYVKNIYRVLLTRGLKGCYVCFTNEQTKKYFQERVELDVKYGEKE
jgi:uncharacterized protein